MLRQYKWKNSNVYAAASHLVWMQYLFTLFKSDRRKNITIEIGWCKKIYNEKQTRAHHQWASQAISKPSIQFSNVLTMSYISFSSGWNGCGTTFPLQKWSTMIHSIFSEPFDIYLHLTMNAISVWQINTQINILNAMWYEGLRDRQRRCVWHAWDVKCSVWCTSNKVIKKFEVNYVNDRSFQTA